MSGLNLEVVPWHNTYAVWEEANTKCEMRGIHMLQMRRSKGEGTKCGQIFQMIEQADKRQIRIIYQFIRALLGLG